MTGVRLRGMPPLPWLSAFPELKVRTYVTAGGKAGVFFFSLDAGNRVAVTVARRWFRLPYYRARMSVTPDQGGIRYASQRVHRGAAPAAFDARYAPVGAVFRASAGSLERWLTERYCLYTSGPPGRGSIGRRFTTRLGRSSARRPPSCGAR